MHNRDPLNPSRFTTRRTSSASRSKRAKASAKKTPRPTSSSTRSSNKGKGQSKVTQSKTNMLEKFDKIKQANKNLRSVSGAQGPKTPPVQGPYQKPSTGMLGSRGGPNKQNVPTSGTKAKPASNNIQKTGKLPKTKLAVKKSKMGRNNLRSMGVAALAGAMSTGSLRNPVSKAKAREAAKSTDKYNTKDANGTVRSRKKVGPKKVGSKKVGPKKVGTQAQSFDRAFAAARKAGKSTFTWNGKSYNTKLK